MKSADPSVGEMVALSGFRLAEQTVAWRAETRAALMDVRSAGNSATQSVAMSARCLVDGSAAQTAAQTVARTAVNWAAYLVDRSVGRKEETKAARSAESWVERSALQ
jgi:hypothetical protein